MPQPRVVRCSNCGTDLTLEARMAAQAGASASARECPVCHLPLLASEAAEERPMSADSLTSQLSELITSARASGLDADVIVHALRDELEFAAEMAQNGRHFCVQLIDLGPQERDVIQRPLRDRRDMLQTRSAN